MFKFKPIYLLICAVLCVFSNASVPAQRRAAKPMPKSSKVSGIGIEQTVFLPKNSPLVSFRIQFLNGAADDPRGKEGLAALTAAMIAQGGTKTQTYDQIVQRFYPMAAGFGAMTDKEMTTFVGTTHVENLPKYYPIISEMLFSPGFRQEDFTRLKQDAINYLQTSLREGNDEELGKERLYQNIYAGTEYAHHNQGTVSSLQRITLQDVKDFYARHYTQSSLVLGLAGGYPPTFPNKLRADFARLPVGAPPVMTEKFRLSGNNQTKIEIIQRETRATAMSLGFPIDVTRGDADFPALALVASYFGQHRSSNSYLYGRIRELRGLNYGDYAYIEYFPRGMFQFQPDPNLARNSQIFQIWIRPVEPQNAHFTLRAALYEFDKLTKEGMSRESFEATKEFLSKYINILTQTQDDELGYALDSKFYEIGNFNSYMKEGLARLTLEDVNRAIKTHLANKPLNIVLITKDADALRSSIVGGKESPISYAAPKPKEITDEDAVIQKLKIDVSAENVKITPSTKIFE